MDIDEQKHGDISILSPIGSLDSHGVHEFETAVKERLNTGAAFFVIDCARVEHLSSAGIRVLVMMVKRLSGVGGRIILSGIGSHIKMVLDIGGLSEFFTTKDSVKEALFEIYPSSRIGRLTQRAHDLLASGERVVKTTHVSPAAHRTAHRVLELMHNDSSVSGAGANGDSSGDGDKPKGLAQMKASVSKMFGGIASKVRRQ